MEKRLSPWLADSIITKDIPLLLCLARYCCRAAALRDRVRDPRDRRRAPEPRLGAHLLAQAQERDAGAKAVPSV